MAKTKTQAELDAQDAADHAATQPAAELKQIEAHASLQATADDLRRQADEAQKAADAARLTVKFPAWRYHASKPGVIVKSQEEADALGDGWGPDVPVNEDGNSILDEHGRPYGATKPTFEKRGAPYAPVTKPDPTAARDAESVGPALSDPGRR